MLSYREYSKFNILMLTNNSDWGFFVDMDDIPCSIYILSNRLTKDRHSNILEIEQTNNINNNIDIITTPISRIVTMINTLYTAVSSLLFNIEIVNDNYEHDYDYDHE